MRITGLHVDGYGILHDLTLDENDLGGTPVVIYGFNEAGKSTLMSFIRGVLFGFKAEGTKPAPVRGGRTGGWLLLEDGGVVWRVQRTGTRNGTVIVELPDGTREGEAFLRDRLLHGISPAFYKNVFALGIDELRKIEDLQSQEVNSYIYGAGTGVKPDKLARAAGILNSSILNLFNPDRRAHRPEINRILHDLDKLARQIRQLEQQPAQYRQLQHEREELAEREKLLLEERRQWQMRKERLENLQKAREPWIKRQRLGAQLAAEKAALPGINSGEENPLPLRERFAALEQLGRDWQQRRNLEMSKEGQQERFNDLRLRKSFLEENLQSTARRKEPWWISAVAALLGLAGFFVAGPGAAAFFVLAGGVGLAVLIHFFLRRLAAGEAERRERHRREARTLEKEMARIQSNIARLDDELRGITRQMNEAASLLGLGEGLAWEDLARIRQELAKEERIQSLERDIAALDEQLLLIAGSPGELADLNHALATTTEAEREEEFEKVKMQLGSVEDRLNRLREELAENKLRLEQMEEGEELAMARQEKGMLEEMLASKAREWRVRTLCATLLDLAREKHERERQPVVLLHASRYLQQMTEGRYARVVAPLSAPDRLEVEQPDGQRVGAAFLSRGAAHQLYLALRLALARHYSERIAPLPLLLDDVMVDFDPRRLEGAVQVLGDIAAGQQVFFFTCHRHILEAIARVLPGYKCLSLNK